MVRKYLTEMQLLVPTLDQLTTARVKSEEIHFPVKWFFVCVWFQKYCDMAER